MAPSTLGTWMRTATFGHLRQMDQVTELAMSRAWAAGAGPGDAPMFIDIDPTICAVHGHQKEGASYGYTRQLDLHPLLASRTDTGEILHARMRKGSGIAQVAETILGGDRLIVRRTKVTDDPRAMRLFPDWCHHAFITNRTGDPVELDREHRADPAVEFAIRDLKHGAGLTTAPRGRSKPTAFGCSPRGMPTTCCAGSPRLATRQEGWWIRAEQ